LKIRLKATQDAGALTETLERDGALTKADVLRAARNGRSDIADHAVARLTGLPAVDWRRALSRSPLRVCLLAGRAMAMTQKKPARFTSPSPISVALMQSHQTRLAKPQPKFTSNSPVMMRATPCIGWAQAVLSRKRSFSADLNAGFPWTSPFSPPTAQTRSPPKRSWWSAMAKST
jgi:hypothetical protein